MPIAVIYLIAGLEGFTTLAIQMIILRLAIPITGSSVVVTSIFVGIILLALSFGYWWGGKIAEASKVNKAKGQEVDHARDRVISSIVSPNIQGYKSLTTILGRFLIISGLWYLIIIIPHQREILHVFIQSFGYELALFMVAILLFFIPIFLASQTVPILIELIPVQSKGKSAGLIFFISTIGSFLGSVSTTLFLFPVFGVHKTGMIVSWILIFLGVMARMPSIFAKQQDTSKNQRYLFTIIICIVFVIFVYFLSKDQVYGGDILKVYDSSYQEIIVRNVQRDGKPVRIFHTNRSYASGFDPETKQSPFAYIRHMVEMTKILQAKRVLVIGAAGFVYPYEIAKFDFVEHIDAIDIDPKVKDIAEQYLLQEQLSSKIRFIPESARYAVRRLAQEGYRYDLVIIDAFMGRSIPAELVTQEFINDVLVLTPSKQVLRNVILDNTMESMFGQKYIATAQSVFGDVYYYDVEQNQNHQNRPRGSTTNIIFASFQHPLYAKTNALPEEIIYTDDYNNAEIDAIQVLKH